MKSAHPLKKEFLLCLYDLLDDKDEEHGDSCQWIDAVNRGGPANANKGMHHCFVC